MPGSTGCPYSYASAEKRKSGLFLSRIPSGDVAVKPDRKDGAAVMAHMPKDREPFSALPVYVRADRDGAAGLKKGDDLIHAGRVCRRGKIERVLSPAIAVDVGARVESSSAASGCP
jgi:hypothetical protein